MYFDYLYENGQALWHAQNLRQTQSTARFFICLSIFVVVVVAFNWHFFFTIFLVIFYKYFSAYFYSKWFIVSDPFFWGKNIGSRPNAVKKESAMMSTLFRWKIKGILLSITNLHIRNRPFECSAFKFFLTMCTRVRSSSFDWRNRSSQKEKFKLDEFASFCGTNKIDKIEIGRLVRS